MVIAYVGLPCQIEAIRKIEALSPETWVKNVSLSIGLFCRENWAYACFRALIEDDYRVKFADVKKFNIKKGNIVAEKDSGTLEFPLKKSKPYVRIGCRVCLDFAAELADISVGAVGSQNKWSTVIVRTQKGMELLNSAEKEGCIETKAIEEVKPGVGLIKKIAREKYKENLEEAKNRKALHIKAKTLEEIKKLSEGKGLANLMSEVVETGNCSSCGACEAVCQDVIKIKDGLPTTIGECKGRCECYLACPRTYFHLPYEGELGRFIKIFSVRAKDSATLEKGQDGGAVTALLSYALDKKIIDAALTVKRDENWKPEAAISRNKKELMKTTGTIYSYSTNLPGLKVAVSSEERGMK
jgi:coenzyme F420 hydrogenase subunit beta